MMQNIKTIIELYHKIFDGHIYAKLSIFGLIFFILIALFAPWIAPQNPYDLNSLDVLDGLLEPGTQLMSGATAWLGTDSVGRDILSSVMFGLRISLFVALLVVIFGSIIGVILGLCAAFYGGWVETAVMRAVDLKISFPGVLLALMILSIFGTGVDKVIIALIIGAWAPKARLVRSVALSEIKKEYMHAAKLSGVPRFHIMTRFLMSNSISPVLVLIPMSISGAISSEATLSFLGVGVPITEPSLGLLIANGNDYIISGKWWISIFPGLVLVSLVLCINVISDRIRDWANPYLKDEG